CSVGTYHLRVTIAGSSGSAVSDLSVIVVPDYTVIITPDVAHALPSQTLQLSAAQIDQFGNTPPIEATPTFTWSMPAGSPGTLTPDGQHTAPAIYTPTTATITATPDDGSSAQTV